MYVHVYFSILHVVGTYPIIPVVAVGGRVLAGRRRCHGRSRVRLARVSWVTGAWIKANRCSLMVALDWVGDCLATGSVVGSWLRVMAVSSIGAAATRH